MTDAFYEALLGDDVEDLYENAPCGYLSTTPDGMIVKVNRTFTIWTAREAEDLVGIRRFAELLTPGGRIFHETHIAPMLRMQDRVREIAVEVVCGDGRRLPVLVNAVMKRDDSGEPQVIRIAVFDATERRAYEEELLAARRRAEQSEAKARALARTLQANLIPPEPPSIPSLDVAARFRPAGAGDEVGGDFYDVFELADRCWAFVLGDVCGKGVEAASVTALARYTVRAAAVQDSLPSSVLATLNSAILRQHPDRYCTAVFGRIDLRSSLPEVTVCSGGHPLPFRLRVDSPAEPVGAYGTLLGSFADVRLHDVTVELAPGDSLVAYTDGFTEARDSDGHFYGEEGLEAAFSSMGHLDATAVVERVTSDVLEFSHGAPRDDLAVLVLRSPAD